MRKHNTFLYFVGSSTTPPTDKCTAWNNSPSTSAALVGASGTMNLAAYAPSIPTSSPAHCLSHRWIRCFLVNVTQAPGGSTLLGVAMNILFRQIGWPGSSASFQQLTVCCCRPNHQFTPQGTILPRKRFAINHLTLQLL
ncbi:unnamed protein product [Nyctereutes procyonoides]|uniref:(raccoon dog) hypothetical protein n=1 Tax=Nyctereutes procyonoides TaxID=34880 RepID=A0A811ZPE6_NYCPR|nr:unnamed protein product [Nyctereutes procyonoides]